MTQEESVELDSDKLRKSVGSSVDRLEDEHILTGEVEYIHDYTKENCLEMAVLRSNHAHALINDIDTEAAEADSACELILTGEDIESQYNQMPLAVDELGEWPLAVDKVRYVGEPIAVVVASDRYAAEDVLDKIEVEYERLDPVVDAEDGRQDETLLHEDIGSNVIKHEELKFGDVDRAFDDADHVFEKEFSWGCISGVPLETSGALAQFDPETGTFTIASNIQAHTWGGKSIPDVLGVPYEKVKLHPPMEIGGSYGAKGSMHRWCILAAAASEQLTQPVKFVEDRFEFLSGGDAIHSTEREYRAKLAVDDDGAIRAFDMSFVDDCGAWPRFSSNQVVRPLGAFCNVYDIQDARYEFEVVVTNKPPAASYRGFGIPSNHFVTEMMIEMAARELDIDPNELRMKNLIPPEEMPYKTASKNVLDSGDYPEALSKIKRTIDENERCEGGLLDPSVVEEKRQEGKYRGVRETILIETGGGVPFFSDMRHERMQADEEDYLSPAEKLPAIEKEHLHAEILPDGSLQIDLATDSTGQGHRTIVTQLMSDEMGIDHEHIYVDYRDSDETPEEVGHAASRLAIMLSGAALGLGKTLKQSLEDLGAGEMDCSPESVNYENGRVTHRETGESLSLAELAELDSTGEYTAVSYAYDHPVTQHEIFNEGLANNMPVHTTAAFNADAPIVEVDIETGEVEILKFYTLRDCGTQLNPTIVEGQYVGGLAQGIGATLLEEFSYDESGQPQSTLLFDYQLPSVNQIPEIEIDHSETPSPFTPIGTKGIGETGMIDGPASVAASINAALEPFGVITDTIPFTSDVAHERIDRGSVENRQ